MGNGGYIMATNEVESMKRMPTVAEMERALELDQCGVIYVNSGDDAKDMADKGDVFADWYEEELRLRYEQHQQRTQSR